ncbi:RRP12-like protein [Trichoplax sp. H2]|nr:RRP12-like protein [Trichoplax sp. H2]|eukprot:RDD41937.1 RRP12-like protein [Trichoplax sp. H2]
MKTSIKMKRQEKRTLRGHSCVSNPEKKTFRNLARASLRSISSETSGHQSSPTLSKEDLNIHDKMNELMTSLPATADDADTVQDDSTEKMTIRSQYTNQMFADVNRLFNSQLTSHKEIFAILAAVTEVIKNQGGTESNVEYFAALMTTLESSSEIEVLTATAYLLRLVITKLPDSILLAKFPAASRIITTLLIDHMDSEDSSLVKSLLRCLQGFLIVQEATVWSLPTTVRSFEILLGFTSHAKPKIRKTAQAAVISLVKYRNNNCIQCCRGTEQGSNSIYVMNLLKEVLPYFSIQYIKIFAENLLKIMLKKDTIRTTVCLEIFYSLFSSVNDASNLTVELSSQIIMFFQLYKMWISKSHSADNFNPYNCNQVLYEYRPNENDIEPTVAWLTVMMQGAICRSKLNYEMGFIGLPPLFSACMPYFLSKNERILSSTTRVLKTVLEECVPPVSEDIVSALLSEHTDENIPAHKLMRCVESGLKYKYQNSWNYILQVVVSYLKVNCFHLLPSICNMYTDFWTPYKKDVENAIATAIKTMGPRSVLSVAPLKLEEHNNHCNFPRSWMIPLLRDNICNTELAYFQDTMLPLAVMMKQKSMEYKNNGHELQATVYKTLFIQIWSLLPGFCTNTTDVVNTFRSIARTLGEALTNKELSQIVCQAIRLLIQTSCKNDEEKLILKEYAKNYLPILFNIYSENKESSCLYVTETIGVYLLLASKELVNEFYAKLQVQLSSDVSIHILRSLLDLAAMMIKVLDTAAINNLYGCIIHYLKYEDILVQKKAYKILEEICSCKSADSIKFISKNVMSIRSLLLESLPDCSVSSKSPRLKCLALLCHKLNDSQLFDYVKVVLPEAIWCTKEVSTKARHSAYALIVEMGRAINRLTNGSEKDNLITYVKLMLPGMAGSTLMICATINSISCIVYEFREIVPRPLIGNLVNTIIIVLQSKSRELIVVAFPRDVVMPYLGMIIQAIADWSSDIKRHFRFKTKILFQRMITKFSYDIITKLAPENCQKVLNNIKKACNRAKRKKLHSRNKNNPKECKLNVKSTSIQSFEDLLNDSEDDDVNDTKTEKRARTKNKLNVKGKAAWINESEYEGPIDFLDASVNQKILVTDPKSFIKEDHLYPSKKKFKVSEDGKIIVTETDDKPLSASYSKGSLDASNSISELRIPKRKRLADIASVTIDANNDRKSEVSFRYDTTSDPFNKKIKKNNPSIGIGYRSKKARGDMMSANRYEPYAYIPMNKQNLNKRKRLKLAGQYRGIVRAAKHSTTTANNRDKLRGKMVIQQRKNISNL